MLTFGHDDQNICKDWSRGGRNIFTAATKSSLCRLMGGTSSWLLVMVIKISIPIVVKEAEI